MINVANQEVSPARVSLTDQVYDLIVSRLMRGDHRPGARLNIEKLAREMNLSPTPIREALARLENTGLVDRTSLRGYRVAKLMTSTDIEDLMDARALMEPQFAWQATELRTVEFLDALAQTIEEMKPTDGLEDVELIRRSWAADEKFHSLICAQLNNPFLQRAYASLGGQLRRFRLISEAGTRTSEEAVDEHRAILSAMSGDRAEEAGEKALLHIQNARTRMLADESASREQSGNNT